MIIAAIEWSDGEMMMLGLYEIKDVYKRLIVIYLFNDNINDEDDDDDDSSKLY